MTVSRRERDTYRFYELLKQLEERVGGTLMLKDCNGHLGWPNQGVYFFFEASEFRSSSASELRVVRVGTHAVRKRANTKLWRRLYEHRYRDGASVFRSLVRSALTRKGVFASDETRRGKDLKVTDYIGSMPFLWVNVSDEPGPDSHRAFIEKNAVALLSDFGGDALDKPSSNWLGICSDKAKVRESGLWNSDHVVDHYRPSFLDILEAHIERTEPLKKRPTAILGS